MQQYKVRALQLFSTYSGVPTITAENLVLKGIKRTEKRTGF